MRRSASRPLGSLAALLGLSAVLVLGCGSGADQGGEAQPTTTTQPPLDPGSGTFTLPGRRIQLEVTTCAEGPGPDDQLPATRELLVEATGEDDGDPYVVRVTRFRSDTGDGPATTTESVELLRGGRNGGAEAEGLVAKRSRVGSDPWVDLLDASADEPLLERDGDVIRAFGRFGPDGAQEDDPGVVVGTLEVRCPG